MKPSKVIKSYGWVQGRYHSEDGFCLLGAIYHAYPTAANRRTNILARLRGKIHVFFMTEWNDEKGRTKKEVIDLLESIGE